MRTRRPVIKSSTRNLHLLLPCLNMLKYLLHRINRSWLKVKNLNHSRFSNRDVETTRLAAVMKQTRKNFIVYFKIVQKHFKLRLVLLNFSVHKVKKVTDRPRNHTIVLLHIFWNFSLFYQFYNFFRPQHAKSLARSALAVRKYCAIKAFSELSDCLLGSLFVHRSLVYF